MKYLLALFTLSAIYIYGCGNDSTTNTNNNGNGETVIFSLDSLSIYLTSSLEAKDTNFTISNASNIKVTFNCSTNADSVFTFALYRLTVGDSSTVYVDSTNNKISELNSNHNISVNASNNYNVRIFIQMNRSNSTPSFIKLKDVKVVKL